MADGSRTRYFRSHNPVLCLESYSHNPSTQRLLLEILVDQIKWFTQTHYTDFFGLEPNVHRCEPLTAQPGPVCIPPGGRKRLSLIQMILLTVQLIPLTH